MADDMIPYVVDILAEHLANGPMPYDEVKALCAKQGVTRAELKTARKELGVKTINTGSTWMWYVPDSEEGNT